ncbi:MAG: hypothetical protein GF333_04025 [Candidatus Omnitrophica bacterium]|nr:hypothetical protein [Candidatus Omnitrophota bacterium]
MFDWFTFAVEIINFLILLFLLKHFLFGRILGAMDERRKKIQTKWDDADRARSDAQEEKERLREQRELLEQKKSEIMRRAEEEAREKKERLVEESRAEVRRRQEGWERALAEGKRAFLDDLRRRLSEEVFAVCAKVLDDLGNERIETRIAEKFLVSLKEMNDDAREEFAEKVRNAGRVKIYSRFALPAEFKKKIGEEIASRGNKKDSEISFDVSAENAYGVVLTCEGYQLDWTLKGYLDSLEGELETQLARQAHSGPNGRGSEK